MARIGAPSRTSGGGRAGVIAGAMLKAAREAAGASQERLGSEIGADPGTVQSWESGRRPLTSTRVGTLAAVRRTLLDLGVPRPAVAALDPAMEADHILARVIDPGPGRHPLTATVLHRDVIEALAWPFTGRPPAAVTGARTAPVVPAALRVEFFARLRALVEASWRIHKGAGDMQPHRQAYYLLGWDEASRAWLATAERAERRAWRPGDGWTPRWVTARSVAIAQARHGNPEPLREFITAGLADERCQAADLTYLAYWVGDLDALWHADTDMTTAAAQAWRGDRLLEHLADRLTPGDPLLELHAASTRALMEARPRLLTEPGRAAALRARVETALDADPGRARRALEDVHLATRLAS